MNAAYGHIAQKYLTYIGLALAALLLFALIDLALGYHFHKLSEQKQENRAPGVKMTAALITMGEEAFNDWRSSERHRPRALLDNPGNFQLGQLEVMRYTALVMKDHLGVNQPGEEDQDWETAFNWLSNDPQRMALPLIGPRLRKSLPALQSYAERLSAGEAVFRPEADGLRRLLADYNLLLGAMNARLLINADESGATPSNQIDDHFYQARGAAFALKEILDAARYDFGGILTKAEDIERLDKIIVIFEAAQFEPVIILNALIGGLWANHSLELYSILEQARQEMNYLRAALNRR